MSSKPFFPMSSEIAIELVKQWIKAGEQPLGIPFGWTQPEDNDTITLGSIYSCNYDNNLYDLLINEVHDYDYNKGKFVYKNELRQTLDVTKRVLRILKEHHKDIRKDKIILPDVIFSTDNLNTTFDKLDNAEKSMYRLSILMLNTMTNGHNLACEYLEYLAHNHFGDDKDNNKQWELYEYDNSSYKGEILEILMENPEDMGILLDYDSPGYDIRGLNTERDYPEDYDYVNTIEIQYQDDSNEEYTFDLIQHVFNVECKYDYERGEILNFLAWCAGWIRKEYAAGNITFNYTDDIDSKILKNWLFQYVNQPILPTFENLE